MAATRDHFESLLALAHNSRWVFFTLLGGFCYFDENRAFLRANALSLEGSVKGLRLVGPYETTPSAADWLGSLGRLQPVTLKQLRDGGFSSFGWILPEETPGGQPLSTDGITIPNGAFAYIMSDGSATFYRVEMGKVVRKGLGLIGHLRASPGSAGNRACP